MEGRRTRAAAAEARHRLEALAGLHRDEGLPTQGVSTLPNGTRSSSFLKRAPSREPSLGLSQSGRVPPNTHLSYPKVQRWDSQGAKVGVFAGSSTIASMPPSMLSTCDRGSRGTASLTREPSFSSRLSRSYGQRYAATTTPGTTAYQSLSTSGSVVRSSSFSRFTKRESTSPPSPTSNLLRDRDPLSTTAGTASSTVSGCEAWGSSQIAAVRNLSQNLGCLDLGGSPKARRPSAGALVAGCIGAGHCGLWNLGNTCYQNSTIQVLNAIPELVDFFHNSKEWKQGGDVSEGFGHLIQQLWRQPAGAVASAKDFRAALMGLDTRWTRGSQEDSHEFMTAVLQKLSDECSRNKRPPKYRELEDRVDPRRQAQEEWSYNREWHNSTVDDLFGFQLHATTVCPQCGVSSQRFDYVTALELPLPSRGSGVHLEECFEAYVRTETLDGDNCWRCSRCAKFVQANKQIRLYRLPTILILTLKRFKSQGGLAAFRASKYTTPVDLGCDPIDVKMLCSPLCVDSRHTKYELIGVVNHSGTLNGGHYTAQAKNPRDGSWYNFDDSVVEKIRRPSGYQSKAYTVVLRHVS